MFHSNFHTFPPTLTQFCGDASVLEGGPGGEANLLTTVLHCGEAADIRCWLHSAWYGATRHQSRGGATQ